MKNYIQSTINYIKSDWASHPTRLALETINWICNVTVGLIIANTVPNPPFLIFCIWISIFSAWSRGSFGLLLASISIFVIDVCGYARLLYHIS
jgi:hypothetical protein